MKTFHPIWERDETRTWYPGNEAASLLIHIIHTWKDLIRLVRIRKERRDEYEKKLLFRYCLIELKSVLDLLDKLQSHVMQADVFSEEEAESRGLLHEERSEAEELFKEFHQARDKVEEDVAEIRNKIGAHRDLESWDHIMELWDKLDPSYFKPLFDTIPPLFDHLKDLDIYEWSAKLEDDSIAIMGTRIYPNQFEDT
jgi:hypothetical protein